MTSNSDIATPQRATVRIPTPSGDEIEAWVYRPAGDGPHPAIVMAHGFAGVKAGGLVPFAERFCREGFTAVAFDYRQWGGSGGQPRFETSVPRQREDYSTVIDWAIADPEIDAERIFVWGTSFSGMHVVEIAATDARLRGAIAQCPLVDGLAGLTMVPPTRSLRLLAVGVLDRLGSLVGRAPIYVKASVREGEWGAIANADAIAGLPLITPPEGTDWNNEVAARSFLGFGAHRPVRKAAKIQCPILMVVPETDTIAPVGPALRVAERAPKGELHRSRGGHYGPYKGGEDYDDVVRLEVEFLHRHAQSRTIRRPERPSLATPDPTEKQSRGDGTHAER
jgi:dienelactone hydrolase